MSDSIFVETWFHVPEASGIPIGTEFIWDEEESRHAVKVLRLRPGTRITLSDGRGGLYVATLEFTDRHCRLCLREKIRQDEPPQWHWALGWLKGRDLEEPIEALCALNSASVTLLSTAHSSEFAGQNPGKLLERLNLKARASLKQSKKTWLTEIRAPITLQKWLLGLESRPLIYAHPGQTEVKHGWEGESHVLIGPEGGFSAAEMELIQARPNTYRLGLGPTRLRAVHAPLVAAGALQALSLA
jgi:16S rRNA (uracil1498-N3)-methyltransferase